MTRSARRARTSIRSQSNELEFVHFMPRDVTSVRLMSEATSSQHTSSRLICKHHSGSLLLPTSDAGAGRYPNPLGDPSGLTIIWTLCKSALSALTGMGSKWDDTIYTCLPGRIIWNLQVFSERQQSFDVLCETLLTECQRVRVQVSWNWECQYM